MAHAEDRMTTEGTTPQGTPVRELEEMWESLLATGWASLAVVPADHDTPIDLVTRSFQTVAARHPGGAIRLIDAQGATMPEGEKLAGDLAFAVKEGTRVVLVVDSLMRSLAGVPLVRHAEVVLLVVRISPSDPEGLRSTIGIVGPERIMGSVAVPSDG